jgi:PPE-repeat protein
MAAAAAPYVTWLNTTAAQAEWAAGQAKLAAGAFETAHTMTVPPVVVTANRALLMSLIATNFFGQNTPAIAATEAQYTEMWAQDALAMYGYAATAAQAAVLPSFTPPPPTTAGPGAQLAALAQSIGSTGARTLATLSQLTAATPDILQAVSSGSSGLIGQLAGPQLSYGAGLVNGEILILVPQLGIQAAQASAHQAAVAAASSGPILHAVKPFLDAGFGPVISRLGTPPMVSVGLGRANMIGPLSVPPSWAGPGAALGRAAPILPNATVSAPSAWTDGPFGQSLLGNMAGQGLRSIASHIPNVKPAPPAR